MATIRFLGGEETGDVGFVQWGRFRFELNRDVPCDDKHILAKAAANRFFAVSYGDGEDATRLDSLAKARAAKAAKAAAAKAEPASEPESA